MAALLGAPIAAVAGAALARAAAQRVPRHPARLEHPRGLRGRRAASWPASSPRASRAATTQLDAIAGRLGPAGDEPRHCSSSTPTSRPGRFASRRPTRCRAARPSKAAASSPADRASPASRPPSRWRPQPPPASRSATTVSRTHFLRVELARRRHARAASSTSAPAARRSPAAATRSGPMSTSRATGTPGTSRRTTPPQGEEIIASARSKSSSAARTARRSASHARSATARSSRRSGCGRTRRASTFATDIDWHDRRILLKARFPLAIRADAATFECAHGVVRRATHRNTSWDRRASRSPAHRFADLSEHGYGVALLNDGKYGHHALGNELGLSLLRSPGLPRPARRRGPAELHLRASSRTPATG